MSLFVGNISKNVRQHELEDAFKKHGQCTIKQKSSYAFIEFESERDAEKANDELQGKNMGGLEIAIEWSKRSGRFNAKESRRPPPRGSESKCYNCDKIGHFARDCRSRRRSRSRSFERRPSRGGDHGRGDRSRSGSQPRYQRRSPPRGGRSPPGRYPQHHRDRYDGDRRGGAPGGRQQEFRGGRSRSRSMERGAGGHERMGRDNRGGNDRYRGGRDRHESPARRGGDSQERPQRSPAMRGGERDVGHGRRRQSPSPHQDRKSDDYNPREMRHTENAEEQDKQHQEKDSRYGKDSHSEPAHIANIEASKE